MSNLQANLKNRAWLLERLRGEVVGPDPSGECVDIGSGADVVLPEGISFWDPKRQASGEELLWRDGPVSRYGAGVLFPRMTTEDVQIDAEQQSATSDELAVEEDIDGAEKVDEIRRKANKSYEAESGEEGSKFSERIPAVCNGPQLSRADRWHSTGF